MTAPLDNTIMLLDLSRKLVNQLPFLVRAPYLYLKYSVRVLGMNKDRIMAL